MFLLFMDVMRPGPETRILDESFESTRFDFDFEIVIKLLRNGYQARELPVNYRALLKFRWSPLYAGYRVRGPNNPSA